MSVCTPIQYPPLLRRSDMLNLMGVPIKNAGQLISTYYCTQRTHMFVFQFVTNCKYLYAEW